MTKLVLTLFALNLAAAPVSVDLTKQSWPAYWIDVPNSDPQGFGVYHFRHGFNLAKSPTSLKVHVSGDNRYILFVNGHQVSFGPARSDLTHWRYETVDLASYLISGRNVLAAVVWNDGPNRAVAQVSNQTGFVLQSDQPEFADLNTGPAWKCIRDKAYSPKLWPQDQRTGYYALGPNEIVDGQLYPWSWQTPGFDDSSWVNANRLTHAAPRDASDSPNRWMLTPRLIPLEPESPEQPLTVRKPSTSTALTQTIPANSKTVLLLDQTYLTTAYPELTVSGGTGSTVNIAYAEALYNPKTDPKAEYLKGNRNDIDGKLFIGPSDMFTTDGGTSRTYRPLFWRTYRYLQLTIQTASKPLTLDSVKGSFVAYPFEKKAIFTAPDNPSDPEIQKILATGWRTARLCAHESYMDCPFYEQLQYGGDARIQMMVSLYMTGDARLMRNGIELLNNSRTAEGVTFSRAPSALQQYIPPFSLWWIGMVHDYWMYVDDPDFVRHMLPGVHAVLSYFSQYQKQNGSMRAMPWWNFVDWVKQWPGGVSPSDPDGGSSAALDLQLLLAYQWAGDLEQSLGSAALAQDYKSAASSLKQTIQATDWDSQRGLFADQPSHSTYSQHVNTLAVIAGVSAPEQGRSIIEKIRTDSTLAQSSIYFRAYQNATLRMVGLGGDYLKSLDPWRQMLADNLTTWSEWNGGDTRSDCHAWGASPNFEFLRTVAGIESAAPGFKKIRITPNLGDLKHIQAHMPHPNGMIDLDFTRNGKSYTFKITLPPNTTGELFLGVPDRPTHLNPGTQNGASITSN